MQLRRLGFALVVAIAAAGSGAEAAFLGFLQGDTGYDLYIDAAGATGSPTGITIYYLNAKGTKIKAMERITVAGGERRAHATRVPKSCSRVLIDVQPPPHATANVEVVQGSNSFAQAAVGDTHMLFDVAPGP
jgi:hypothetical protein